MARLPQPGSDNGTWGDILNEYLSQTLKSDGTLKENSVTSSAIADNAVTAATIQDGSITEAQLNGAVQTKLNAAGGVPEWDDITNKPAVIAAGADQAAARSAIGAGTSSLALGTTSTTAKAGDYTPSKADVGLSNVDNTSDAVKNSATATLANKTLVNPKINAVHDTSSRQLVDLVTIPDAVNHVYITNQSTGNSPTIGVDGDDGDIGLAIAPKGNGRVNLFGNSPTIAAAGGYNGGNLNLNLRSQGTGVVQANDIPIVTTTGATTLTDKTISGASNTLSDIAISSLATTGVADASTFLRGDGSWQVLGSSGSSPSGSLSGFPLRRSGEVVVASPQELANAFASTTAPNGTKTIVLAESWDKPGILKHIWIACGNTTNGNGFLEQGGTIRIYTDNAATPAVSMTLGDFFILSNHSDVYSTPRVGRTNRGAGDQSSAYRYVHMPFQKYLRVEIENTTNTDTVFYGQADYSLIDSFAELGNQQLAYSIKGQRAVNQPVRQPITICDFAGAGQIESLWLSFSGADAGDNGVLEGNIEIYIDGETFPSWWASGTEDAFNGGWYTMPVGGYPAGRAGNSDQSGQNSTLYRFFVDDPIFFSNHLKVVMWPGQPRQASIVSATVDYAGYVGVWSNTPVVPNYRAVDTGASPISDDQMNQAAGAIDSGQWNQSGDRTQATATGTSFVVPYGNANPDEDVRIARRNLSLPTDYWVETRLRITDASHDEQQAHLLMLGASPDPYFGSAIHLQLYRHHADDWSLNVRDDFATSFVINIGSGRDLTNQWVRMAFKKVGTRVTAYYSMNPAPAAWIPIGSWIASKSDPALGVGTWTAAAEFDYVVVRPLKTVTS